MNLNLAEFGQKELCKCSRRDATYGALVVMAVLIVLTLLREAPLIVIVADNKRADSFMRHYHPDTGFHPPGGLSTEHGPPVPDKEPVDSSSSSNSLAKATDLSSSSASDAASTKGRPLRVFSVATNISYSLFTQFYDSARKNRVHV